MCKDKRKGNISNTTGAALIALLGISLNAHGRVATIIGDKSEYGLAMTVKRLMDDPTFAKMLLKEKSS